DTGFQHLDFLLLRSQRFADWGSATAFGLKLLNPAAKYGFTDIQRTACFGNRIPLVEHQGCGFEFEFGSK
ncbi:hypothetical protein WH04_20255, partial [Aeromonas salmonicida subsp. salmonicida]